MTDADLGSEVAGRVRPRLGFRGAAATRIGVLSRAAKAFSRTVGVPLSGHAGATISPSSDAGHASVVPPELWRSHRMATPVTTGAADIDRLLRWKHRNAPVETPPRRGLPMVANRSGSTRAGDHTGPGGAAERFGVKPAPAPAAAVAAGTRAAGSGARPTRAELWPGRGSGSGTGTSGGGGGGGPRSPVRRSPSTPPRRGSVDDVEALRAQLYPKARRNAGPGSLPDDGPVRRNRDGGPSASVAPPTWVPPRTGRDGAIRRSPDRPASPASAPSRSDAPPAPPARSSPGADSPAPHPGAPVPPSAAPGPTSPTAAAPTGAGTAGAASAALLARPVPVPTADHRPGGTVRRSVRRAHTTLRSTPTSSAPGPGTGSGLGVGAPVVAVAGGGWSGVARSALPAGAVIRRAFEPAVDAPARIRSAPAPPTRRTAPRAGATLPATRSAPERAVGPPPPAPVRPDASPTDRASTSPAPSPPPSTRPAQPAQPPDAPAAGPTNAPAGRGSSAPTAAASSSAPGAHTSAPDAVAIGSARAQRTPLDRGAPGVTAARSRPTGLRPNGLTVPIDVATSRRETGRPMIGAGSTAPTPTSPVVGAAPAPPSGSAPARRATTAPVGGTIRRSPAAESSTSRRPGAPGTTAPLSSTTAPSSARPSPTGPTGPTAAGAGSDARSSTAPSPSSGSTTSGSVDTAPRSTPAEISGSRRSTAVPRSPGVLALRRMPTAPVTPLARNAYDAEPIGGSGLRSSAGAPTARAGRVATEAGATSGRMALPSSPPTGAAGGSIRRVADASSASPGSSLPNSTSPSIEPETSGRGRPSVPTGAGPVAPGSGRVPRAAAQPVAATVRRAPGTAGLRVAGAPIVQRSPAAGSAPAVSGSRAASAGSAPSTSGGGAGQPLLRRVTRPEPAAPPSIDPTPSGAGVVRRDPVDSIVENSGVALGDEAASDARSLPRGLVDEIVRRVEERLRRDLERRGRHRGGIR